MGSGHISFCGFGRDVACLDYSRLELDPDPLKQGDTLRHLPAVVMHITHAIQRCCKFFYLFTKDMIADQTTAQDYLRVLLAIQRDSFILMISR
ncbi:hypothetical protein [Parasphingorhabdus marina]|uniref:hypothetical protein n=1 Tax=Parasphingorhabdus marina TaxID=394732 RepID=UPI001161368F|nr:hypothetical protein [Parasphingorhabdus marina]